GPGRGERVDPGQRPGEGTVPGHGGADRGEVPPARYGAGAAVGEDRRGGQAALVRRERRSAHSARLTGGVHAGDGGALPPVDRDDRVAVRRDREGAAEGDEQVELRCETPADTDGVGLEVAFRVRPRAAVRTQRGDPDRGDPAVPPGLGDRRARVERDATAGEGGG